MGRTQLALALAGVCTLCLGSTSAQAYGFLGKNGNNQPGGGSVLNRVSSNARNYVSRGSDKLKQMGSRIQGAKLGLKGLGQGAFKRLSGNASKRVSLSKTKTGISSKLTPAKNLMDGSFLLLAGGGFLAGALAPTLASMIPGHAPIPPDAGALGAATGLVTGILAYFAGVGK